MNNKLFLSAAMVALAYSSLGMAMTPVDKMLMKGISEVDMKQVEEAINQGANIDISTKQGKDALQAAYKNSSRLEGELESAKNANKYGHGPALSMEAEDKIEADSLKAAAIDLYLRDARAKKSMAADPELQNALAELKMLIDNGL